MSVEIVAKISSSIILNNAYFSIFLTTSRTNSQLGTDTILTYIYIQHIYSTLQPSV